MRSGSSSYSFTVRVVVGVAVFDQELSCGHQPAAVPFVLSLGAVIPEMWHAKLHHLFVNRQMVVLEAPIAEQRKPRRQRLERLSSLIHELGDAIPIEILLR